MKKMTKPVQTIFLIALLPTLYLNVFRHGSTEIAAGILTFTGYLFSTLMLLLIFADLWLWRLKAFNFLFGKIPDLGGTWTIQDNPSGTPAVQLKIRQTLSGARCQILVPGKSLGFSAGIYADGNSYYLVGRLPALPPEIIKLEIKAEGRILEGRVPMDGHLSRDMIMERAIKNKNV